jgi:hypothetical protein
MRVSPFDLSGNGYVKKKIARWDKGMLPDGDLSLELCVTWLRPWQNRRRMAEKKRCQASGCDPMLDIIASSHHL